LQLKEMLDLPHHLYVTIDAGVISKKESGSQKGVLFSLQPNLGGIFGGHLLLECGAVYRNIPLNSITVDINQETKYIEETINWSPQHLQTWDCYSENYAVIEYNYLRGLCTKAKGPNGEILYGIYKFTLIPKGDGFSRHLDQAKELVFCHHNTSGRIFIRTTDKILFEEKSFTTKVDWPTHLKTQYGLMPSTEKTYNF
jgi:hypothetical protein